MGRDCRAGEQNAGAEQAEQKVTKCHCRYFTIHKLDTAIDRSDKHKSMDSHMRATINEARTGLAEGGIPIGSVLVHDGKIIGRGHNRRVQQGSAILHGEMDALENAGRLPAAVYAQSTLYTTLSPCAMCSGAILLYGIAKVVIGENQTFMGEEQLLRSRGVEVDVLQDAECIALMRDFIAAQPQLWSEDIGEDG
jgi:creatinine deaminase